jgi:hypothetical protein
MLINTPILISKILVAKSRNIRISFTPTLNIFVRLKPATVKILCVEKLTDRILFNSDFISPKISLLFGLKFNKRKITRKKLIFLFEKCAARMAPCEGRQIEGKKRNFKQTIMH